MTHEIPAALADADRADGLEPGWLWRQIQPELLASLNHPLPDRQDPAPVTRQHLTADQRDGLREFTQHLRDARGITTLQATPAGDWQIVDADVLRFIAHVLDQAVQTDDARGNPQHGAARAQLHAFTENAWLMQQRHVELRASNAATDPDGTQASVCTTPLRILSAALDDAWWWNKDGSTRPCDHDDVDTARATETSEAKGKPDDCVHRHYDPLDQADRQLLLALLADRIHRLNAAQ